MFYKVEFTLEEFSSWGGATDTINKIISSDKEEEFYDLLENSFTDEYPTDTEVNDFLWFERDYIYESLGLDDEGKIIGE